MIRAEEPADRANTAGPVGEREMAWTRVPTGMSRRGRQFPGFKAACRRAARSIWGAKEEGEGGVRRSEGSEEPGKGGKTD